MYTVKVNYSEKTHSYDEFKHITKISVGKEYNAIPIEEKNFTSYSFPHDKSLRLHSAEKEYLIYPNKIIYIEFEKEPD